MSGVGGPSRRVHHLVVAAPDAPVLTTSPVPYSGWLPLHYPTPKAGSAADITRTKSPRGIPAHHSSRCYVPPPSIASDLRTPPLANGEPSGAAGEPEPPRCALPAGVRSPTLR